MKLRFSIRTLLAVMVVAGGGTVVGIKWWTTPYAVVESTWHGNFEYQVRRTLNGGCVHVGPIRYSFSGFEFDLDGQKHSWFVRDDGGLTERGDWFLDKNPNSIRLPYSEPD